MARKKRDYKAEYAVRKQKAQRAGYKSVREYGDVRKALRIPRNASPISRPSLDIQRPRFMETLRSRIPNLDGLIRASQFWSDHHSHIPATRFDPNWSAERIVDYHRAFVDRIPELSRRKRAREKRFRIWQYFTKYGYDSRGEWREDWKSELSA